MIYIKVLISTMREIDFQKAIGTEKKKVLH